MPDSKRTIFCKSVSAAYDVKGGDGPVIVAEPRERVVERVSAFQSSISAAQVESLARRTRA